MEEDIKKLKSYLNGDKIYDTELDYALKNLITRYRELEEENKILKNKQTKIIADSFHEKMAKKFDEGFISKKQVKEKMEESDILFFETKDVRYANRYKAYKELLES